MLLLNSNYNVSPLTIKIILFTMGIFLLLYILRNASKKEVSMIMLISCIILTSIYLFKTINIEIDYYKKFHTLELDILPFDSCSIIMYTGIIAALAKGKIKSYAESWIIVGGLSLGVSTIIYRYIISMNPFIVSPTMYTLFWHFLMIFLALLLVITDYCELNKKVLFKGFFYHFIISLIVIPIDFILKLDFMFYHDLSQIPIFNRVARIFINKGLSFLNPPMMLILYFLLFVLAYIICVILKKICDIMREVEQIESKSNR